MQNLCGEESKDELPVGPGQVRISGGTFDQLAVIS